MPAGPGSLFVVGDPKQSIYRFRRADIVTYNQVKNIIVSSGGAVVPLTANFRTIGMLITWSNQVFDQVFPAKEDTWSPARCPMQVGRQEETKGQMQGLYVLSVPDSHGNNDLAVEYESDVVARTIRNALDVGLTLPRTPKELEHGVAPAAVPGDFLIITRAKKHLAIYARKLSELGIPNQVTGGSAWGRSGNWRCFPSVWQPWPSLKTPWPWSRRCEASYLASATWRSTPSTRPEGDSISARRFLRSWGLLRRRC